MASKKRNISSLKITSSSTNEISVSSDSPLAKRLYIHQSNFETCSEMIEHARTCQNDPNDMLFKYKLLRDKEEFQLKLSEGDFEELQEQQFKTTSHVWKVRYKPTNQIMRRKAIRTETQITKKGLLELKTLRACVSPYIVNCFGNLNEHWGLSLFTEYMDGGSLEFILSRVRRIPENILGLVSFAVIKGLTYLYEEHSVLHHGIAPSNIYVNTKGEIKLSEFELCQQNAQFAVGNVSKCYMAPERLKTEVEPTFKSDIWSLGITLLELATGRYPFFIADEFSSNSIFEILVRIANLNCPPTLPDDGSFSVPFSDFIKKTLELDYKRRADFNQLDGDIWICCVAANRDTIDIAGFVREVEQTL